MPLVRILIDGYSMLHSCPEIAPGQARHSHRARQELVKLATDYHDASGTPVTIVFDGAGAPPGVPKVESTAAVEVLFSKAGQTADDLIERAAYRLSSYGDVMVVTDDYAERDTIISFGGVISSCGNFFNEMNASVADVGQQLRHHNRKEKTRFGKPPL